MPRRNFECLCRVVVKCTDHQSCRLKCKAAATLGSTTSPTLRRSSDTLGKGRIFPPGLDDFYDAVPANQPDPYNSVVANTNPVNFIANEQGLGPNFTNSTEVWR